MTKLASIKLEDGTVIFIEATEDVKLPLVKVENPTEEEEEEEVIDKGLSTADVQKQIAQNFQAIQVMIRAYTIYSLNAFKKIPIENVNKVTLEFGIQVGGEAGIPYITKGTAQSNLKITVECSLPENKLEV